MKSSKEMIEMSVPIIVRISAAGQLVIPGLRSFQSMKITEVNNNIFELTKSIPKFP